MSNIYIYGNDIVAKIHPENGWIPFESLDFGNSKWSRKFILVQACRHAHTMIASRGVKQWTLWIFQFFAWSQAKFSLKESVSFYQWYAHFQNEFDMAPGIETDISTAYAVHFHALKFAVVVFFVFFGGGLKVSLRKEVTSDSFAHPLCLSTIHITLFIPFQELQSQLAH